MLTECLSQIPSLIFYEKIPILEIMLKFYHSPAVCNYVSKSATLHEFHDDPQLIIDQITVVHLHNVRMMVVPHDHHLHIHNNSDYQVMLS